MTQAAALGPKCVDAMDDDDFDALLPASARRFARVYWTRVAEARRVAELLVTHGARRVLDIGSGVGKFCIVAAARAPAIQFDGVEHRPKLVETGQSLLPALGLPNVSFAHGDATSVSWEAADALYVFNPFAENRMPRADQFDQEVELSRTRHIADIRRMSHRLARQPDGALLVTYHGLGGPIPGAYQPVHVEAMSSGWMRVWRKVPRRSSQTFWLEARGELGSWTAPPGMFDDPGDAP